MRNAILSLGAVGGALFATLLLSGALVDEVEAPAAASVLVTRYNARPDLGANLCKVDATWVVAFSDQAAAAALGLPAEVEADRVLLVPCSAVATLLNSANACKLSDSFPPGWPAVALGNPAPCPAAPGGAP